MISRSAATDDQSIRRAARSEGGSGVLKPGVSGAAVPALVLLMYGSALAMPAYSWAQPIEVVHGVYLHELILTVFLASEILLGQAYRLVSNAKSLRLTVLWTVLGLLGVVSAGANGARFLDVFQALRLILIGGLAAAVAQWSAERTPTFAIRWYVLGLALGGLLNLYFTFTQPELTIDILPVLRSRNGAGGVLGAAVVLSAWLAIERRTRWDAPVALFCAVISVTACAISFSKTAILIGLCGIIAWSFVLGHAIGQRRGRLRSLLLVVSVVGGVSVTLDFVSRAGFTEEIVRSVGGKFLDFDLRQKYSGGDRYLYFVAVGEVVVANPFVGVSYSGFYDAIVGTHAYETGEMADEDPDPERRAVANPHNSYLYYIAANGVPGLLGVIAISVACFGAFWSANREAGKYGVGVWASLVCAYGIYGMTLPTLFNTAVLVVPAAAAIVITRSLPRTISPNTRFARLGTRRRSISDETVGVRA
jgi:O-antigen ligase